MRRFKFLIFIALCGLMFSSCSAERQADKLREKIRFVSLDQIVPHGMSGVDASFTVANETRHKITLEEAELTLSYDRNEVAMLQLREAITLPKRFEGQLDASARMKIYDPLSAIAVFARIRRNQTEQMTVSIDAKVKAGPVRKNISIEDMELQKFLSKFALSTQAADEI